MLFIVGGALQCGGERTVHLLVRSAFRNPAIPSDLGPGCAGLHDDHGDAERLYFQAQTFGHALQRELGPAVQRLVRERDQAADGANVDDVPTTLATHGGQHGPARQERADEVHVDLPFGFLHRCESRGPAMAMPALFTTASSRPSRSRLASTARCTDWSSDTSIW